MKHSAEILCIGTEILLGNIVNTNSADISRVLADLGIDLYHHTVVGDNRERLREALDVAFSRCDIVITTGGLGPTYDDLSKETIAEWFGLPMEMHEPSAQRIKAFFEKIGSRMSENNIKQAMMPKGCTVLDNENGTAPGAIIEGKGKIAIMMPGPPREVRPMLHNQVAPWLAKLSDHVLRSHNIHFFGIGESQLESELRDEMESMKNPTLAPYAKEGEVMLRVTASAKTAEEADRLMEPVIEQLQKRYEHLIYGIDVGDLQTAALQILKEKGLTVAFAESCTGGLVSKRLTEISGASGVFGCGVVSYSNKIKESVLGVRAETLAQSGAVSPQTAREMAEGVRRVSGADIGISITGIAGPDGGTPEKPVGLVYIGVHSDWHREVKGLHLSRGHQEERELIRLLASSYALSLLRRTALLKP